MADANRHDRLQPSLLDRLTDNSPESKRDSFDQQALSMQQLRQAVMRDLAWLLNTTNLEATDDLTGHTRAQASTLNYGVPSFTGLTASSDRQTSLEHGIAAAIRQFEPRIKPNTLRVRLREESSGDALPAMVFEIQGELWAQPVPQQLFLETSIDIATRLAVVTDARARG
jgi:type VI secretion system protein ImpF